MGSGETVAVPPARGAALTRIRAFFVPDLLTAGLWVIALVLLVEFCARRYAGAMANALVGGNQPDFRTSFQAGQLVSQGKSPFGVDDNGYVYFAPVALLLSPFAHAVPLRVFRAWTVLELCVFTGAIAAMTYSLRQRLASWQVPVLFALCAVTGLHLWPMTFEFFVGNDDIYVLLLVVLAAAALNTRRPLLFGIAVGGACLLKVWPALIILAVLQTGIGSRARVRAVAGVALMILIGLVTNLIPAGLSEFRAFFTNVFQAKSQQLHNDSVGGIPRLLFSKSGLARPLFVSSELRYLLTAILAAWVVGLLVLSLRTRSDPMLCVVNTALFAVLIIPVSHLAYTILALPILWYWIAAVPVLIEGRRRSSSYPVVQVLLLLTLVAWYLVQQHSWPTDGFPAGISALRYSVVFAANLALLSASVLAGWFLGDELDRAGAGASARDQAPSDQAIPTTPALRGPPPIEP